MVAHAEATWTEHTAPAALLLRVRDPFAAVEGERLAQRIVGLAGQGQDAFVVDLSGLLAASPEAMAPVVDAARRLHAAGVRISVVFDSLLQVCCTPGIEELFDVAVTAQDALERLSRHRSDATGTA